MKKICMAFVAISIAFCCSCSQTGEVKKNNSCYETQQFDSIDELVNYIKNDDGTKSQFRSARDGEALLYKPAQPPFGSEFKDVELINTYIYYSYTFGDTYSKRRESPPTVGESSSNKVSSEPDERANSIEAKIDEAGGYDHYIRENGLQSGDERAIHDLINNASVGWNFAADGQTYLNKFISMNPEKILQFEDHPGYWYSKATYPGLDDVFGYMIYWVEDGYYFEAYVPSQYVDEFFETELLTTVNIE